MKSNLFLAGLLFIMAKSVFAIAHIPTANQGNISFSGSLYAPTCVVGFESEEQSVTLGEHTSNDISHEQHNNLVIELFECSNKRANETDISLNGNHITQSNGQMIIVTFTGETLADDPELFAVEPKESGLGLKLMDSSGRMLHPRQPSVIYPLEKGGDRLSFSTQLIEYHKKTFWRGKVESLITFHIQYP